MDKRVAYSLALLCGTTFAYSDTYAQCLALLIFPVTAALEFRGKCITLLLFYSSATIPIIGVISDYTGSPIYSPMPFIGLVILNTGVVAFAMLQRKIPVAISVPAALLMLSFPPLAYINPITLLPLAGWLFPGFGLLGIALLLLAIGTVYVIPHYKHAGYACFLSLLIPIGVANAESQTAIRADEPHQTIAAISISRPYDEKLDTRMMRVAYRFEELDSIRNSNADISVLPESIFGEWQKSDGDILSSARGTVFGGGRVHIDEYRHHNVIVNAKTGEAVYEQLNPPLIKTRNKSRAVPGRGAIRETGLTFLLCYELTNSWIVYKAYSSGDKPVIWVSNLSWSNTTYLNDRMNSLHRAWSRLYKKQQHSAVMSNA